MHRATLKPSSLRDELQSTQSILSKLNLSIECNFLANAILTLENANDLGLTKHEAQLAAQAHYRKWLRYFDACKAVQFNAWRVPASYSFK